MNHHPLKKLNLHTNIANNLRMSMYNTNIPNSTTIINDPTYHRLFTRKTTHSLDKINRGNHVHIVDTSNFQKQLLNATTSPTAKKLTSYQSTKNIHRSNSINNNNNTANTNDLSFSPTRQRLNNYTTVMNHSSLGGNNTINNSTNNINNYTQSNINTTNQNKIKERLIQNLKNNFNQERIRRKKMLSVNVNVNLNQHYSMIHNNINDSISNNNNNTNNNNTTTVNESISNYNTQSYYDNTNTVGNVNLYKRNYFAKKDQPLKLYTDANAFNTNTQGSSNKKSNNGDNSSSNSNCNYGEGFRNRKLINSKSNHNLSLSTNNNNNKHHSSSNNVIVNSMETFYDLELKMDKMLKENKSNSKSKKYNITKMIFEEGIKQFTILISNLLTNYPTSLTTSTSTHGYSNSMNYTNTSNHNHYMENNNIIITFLRNILKVYHESFLAYSNENKTLRDKVDKLQSSSYQLDTKLNDYSKQIKEKETEITSLKSQITKLTLSLSTKDKDKETITNIIKPTTTTTTPNPNNNSTSLKTSSQIMPTDPRQVTFSATDDDLINSSIIPINKHQEMIKDLNTKNINDLDALYFNDKVEMAESNRDISPKGGGHVVPKLNFGVIGSDSSSSSTMCGVGLANVHFNVPKIINNVYLKKN